MIFNLKSGGIISIYIFLCFFLNGCTTPEENAIKVPESDSVAIAPEKSGAKVDTVEIKDMKFQPAEITVKKGDTIVWINHDMVTHCVTEENTKVWTSGNIAGGESWKMAIEASVDYFCAIHQVMKGKIKVE